MKYNSEEASHTLTLSSGVKISNPDDDQIRQALESLDVQRDGEGFAILARSKMTYAQVSGDSKIGFDLEYQERSVSCHYHAKRDDFTLDEIIKILCAYRDKDVRWSEIGDFDRIQW